ncbi:hypothetical protein CSKR_112737 [Clonorchis sinensis]|uniref:Uncharacterized protein n=1 Tax=Clonorchis sinensis TaxID=79923 RepID=A0A3R7FSZ9_CLOSI|nr:hypothetical protein CSKR_112737 [Clonorchis sinensis]
MYRCHTMDVFLGIPALRPSSMQKSSCDWRRKSIRRSGQVNHCTIDCSACPKSHSPESQLSQRVEKDIEWRPTRRRVVPNGDQATDLNDPNECSPVHLQEAIKQDLVDLLRSQIACLLEENEKILVTLDDYRQRFVNLQREQKESAPDPTAEHLALQTELGDARLREAELTVAFGELQERVAEIDRIIETDPEMLAFFNAVTISTTTLSKQKPLQRTMTVNPGSPSLQQKRMHRADRGGSFSSSQKQCGYISDRRTTSRYATSPGRTRRSRVTGDSYNNTTDLDAEQTNRSGLESPQSDSGCSLNSHTTSDLTEHANSYEDGVSHVKQRPRPYDTHHKEHFAEGDTPEQGYEEDSCFKSNRPEGFVSLLRRSRSSVAEHPYASGFHSETHSPSSQADNHFTFNYRHTDNTPTPTDGGHTPLSPDEPLSTRSEPRGTVSSNTQHGLDRFNKLRASFKQSFGLGSAKPDFRMEAFAARQGEARALLSLRETRMELLRVQSRCQTLQRHMERLEAINTSRMEELEAAVGVERDLRQEIRGLQRRIFELEAEHREFRVNQRIKEMELMSKLAEVNLQLSHVELTNQQAVVWTELNKAHDAASDLMTHTRVSQQSIASSPIDPIGSKSSEDNGRVTVERSIHERGKQAGQQTSAAPVKVRPSMEHSLTRLESGKRRNENAVECDQNISCQDLSKDKSSKLNQNGPQTLFADKFQGHRDTDQSLGSLSELRLQPDQSLMGRTGLR